MTEKELYIFSNGATPPVKTFEVGLLHNGYIELSTHLNPNYSVAPSYDTPNGHPVKNLEEHKENHSEFDLIHVFKISGSEIIEGNEVFTYKYSHKEFNLKGERKGV